jgi:hypothetical protein
VVDFSKNPHGKSFNETGGANGTSKGLIAGEVAKGPNFNGHYRIIDWSCGTMCTSVLIVDVKNGEIIYAPFTEDWKDSGDRPDFRPWKDLNYHANSSLMVVNGNFYDFEAEDLNLPYLIDVSRPKN